MTVPSPWVRIVSVAVLLAAALCGLVIREDAARNRGQEVRLPITGYDPRSLLSGHYVQFAIEWRTPGAGRCPPGSDPMSPSLPWVALRREGEGHVAGGAASTRAEASRLGDIVARGRLSCIAASTTAVTASGEVLVATPMSESIRLDLGIDRIHLDQAQAVALETRLRARQDVPAFAVFSIDSDGRARLKGLIVEGQRYDLTWW